jgi:hypothetical protein
VWAAVCEGDASRTRVYVRDHYVRPAGGPLVTLHVAVAVTPAAFWREVSAFGRTDGEALWALWELVCLHAQVRVDDIEAALRGGA